MSLFATSLVSSAALKDTKSAESQADILFQAHKDTFYQADDGGAWFLDNTASDAKVSFWMWAEQIEMVLDAYERTRRPETLDMFSQLVEGFTVEHGRRWEKNPFNDDIMWAVIACIRGYGHTRNPDHLTLAKENFDLCYARAHSDELGGGLWWKTSNKSKNACVNGPAVIAAWHLAQALTDNSYLDKARQLFEWEKTTLFDPKTGRVADHISREGKLHDRVYTYNQGTFIGAADLLGARSEAWLATQYTIKELCKGGLLPPANEQGDGAGFHGIAARWIARFAKRNKIEKHILPWLEENARAAWQARNFEQQLCWPRWPEPTPEVGTRYSWGLSTAVVVLQMAEILHGGPLQGMQSRQRPDIGPPP